MKIAAALLLLSSFAASACSGGGEKAGAPGIVSATAERDTRDGAALPTTTVRVKFDRPLKFASARVPVESFLEFSVPQPDGSETRVLVATAEETDGETRELVLHTAALIPDGSTFKVRSAAFVAGAEGEISAEVDGDLQPIEAFLATATLEPGDGRLLESSVTLPITAETRDEAAMRRALETHLERRGAPAEVVREALATYDGMPLEIVPAPKARAAIAALTGTFAEPAIAWLLTRDNCTGQPVARIAFEPPPGDPRLLGQVTHLEDGRRVVSLNPSTEGEPLERLMSIIAHEAVHCDPDASLIEEVVATAFDTFLYITLLTADPGIIEGGTPLALDLNVDAMAMINSGRARPESIGVLTSLGITSFFPPGRTQPTSFADFVAAAYGDIPPQSGTEPLAQIYANVLAQATGQDPGDPFDLRYLDALLGDAIPPAILFAAIEVLDLAPTN